MQTPAKETYLTRPHLTRPLNLNKKDHGTVTMSAGVPLYVPKVVHCRRAPSGSFILCDRTTKWGNPFVLGRDGDRDEVINSHSLWIRNQPRLLESLPELRGHDLGCWCAPQRCHCDTLLLLANP